MSEQQSSQGGTSSASGVVTVYWRPGCPYCARLLGDLDRIGLPLEKINIWEDSLAAATVRSIAGGNETVPAVVVGGTGMVNPRAGEVVAAVRAAEPELVDRLDPAGLVAVAKGRWSAGLLVSVVLAVGWFGLAAANPTTTYHVAPLVVAAVWPVGRRLRPAGSLPVATALATALGGGLLALLTTLLLAVTGSLSGPTVFGIPGPLAEAVIGTAVGTLIGAGIAMARRRG